MVWNFFAKNFDTQEVQEAKSRGVISKKWAKTRDSARSDPGPRFLMDLGPSRCLRGVGLIQVHHKPKSKGQGRKAHHKAHPDYHNNAITPSTSSLTTSNGEKWKKDRSEGEPDWFRWTGLVHTLIKMAEPVHLHSKPRFLFLLFSLSRSLSFSHGFFHDFHTSNMILDHKLWIKSQIIVEQTQNTSILLFFWRKLFESFDFDIFGEKEFETFRSTSSLKKSVQNVSIYMFLQVWFWIFTFFRVSTFFSNFSETKP